MGLSMCSSSHGTVASTSLAVICCNCRCGASLAHMHHAHVMWPRKCEKCWEPPKSLKLQPQNGSGVAASRASAQVSMCRQGCCCLKQHPWH